jgi:hypothetical protein
MEDLADVLTQWDPVASLSPVLSDLRRTLQRRDVEVVVRVLEHAADVLMRGNLDTGRTDPPTRLGRTSEQVERDEAAAEAREEALQDAATHLRGLAAKARSGDLARIVAEREDV